MSRLIRRSGIVILFLPIWLAALLLPADPGRAAPSPFDLAGPRLDVAVTRNGATLPLEWVPNLAEGDRLSIKLDLPAGQGDRFRLIAAFLRGAVDRPPDAWFHDTVSGKAKGGDLSLVVPKGAQQLVLFVLPEHGAGRNAIVSAVRKQPGTFVRAVQDLNQASLDRARLDTFLDLLLQAGRKDPASVNATSQALTRSLAIKLKAECLQQPAELQAACLTGDRETLLFADTHSSALADTLTGAPVDLAFQLSATPQAGYGSYSSYIGVVRDLFRLFGAFQSSQLQFVPALVKMGGSHLTLLLNAPLSFAKPASVMVIGLPAVEAPKPPPLQAAGATLLCAAAGTVLPVEGAPLIYATRYAHDMMLRVQPDASAPFEIPVHADAARGGFVLDRALPDPNVAATLDGRIAGKWGFTPFEGPRFQLSNPRVNRWTAAADASLVVGRINTVTLKGQGAGCVDGVEMKRGDAPAQALTWKQDGSSGLTVDIPLEKASPGPVTLTITAAAESAPVTITLPALQEVGRIDSLSYAAGDDTAMLTGSRLDQVREVKTGTLLWHPRALARTGGTDQLMLYPVDPASADLRALTAGERRTADVVFTGNRHKSASLTVAQQRPVPILLSRSAQPRSTPGMLPIALRPEDAFAQDSRVTFAFHLDAATSLTGRESIEVATAAGDAVAQIVAGHGYDLQDPTTGIVTFVPVEALGASAHGPLKFRIIREDGASRWSPLGTAVRLPDVQSIACTSAAGCIVTGTRLFLIESIATNDRFDGAQTIPDGYTDGAIQLAPGQSPSKGMFLRLRDAKGATGTLVKPTTAG